MPPVCACPHQSLAVLRLDGDMYQSTWETYVNLYSRVSVGGYTIVDDVPIWGSRAATLDFRALMGLHKDVLVVIDDDGVYWRRSAGPTMVGYPNTKWPLFVQLMRSSTLVGVVSGSLLVDNSLHSLLTADDQVCVCGCIGLTAGLVLDVTLGVGVSRHDKRGFCLGGHPVSSLCRVPTHDVM